MLVRMTRTAEWQDAGQQRSLEPESTHDLPEVVARSLIDQRVAVRVIQPSARKAPESKPARARERKASRKS